MSRKWRSKPQKKERNISEETQQTRQALDRPVKSMCDYGTSISLLECIFCTPHKREQKRLSVRPRRSLQSVSGKA